MNNINRQQAMCIMKKVLIYYNKNKENIQERSYYYSMVLDKSSPYMIYNICSNSLDKFEYVDSSKVIEISLTFSGLSISLMSTASGINNNFTYKLHNNKFLRLLDPVYRYFRLIEKDVLKLHKLKIKKEKDLVKREHQRRFNQVYDDIFTDIDDILLGRKQDD